VNSSVDPQAVDENTLPAGDVRSVEGNFKALWESARRAADVIAGLRQERQALQEHVALLERELQQVRAESAQFRKQTAEHVQEGGVSFAGGERDLFAAKVKELIAKLDAYL
jgi:hypothetical protein